MFVFGYQNWPITIAAVLVLWVVICFSLALTWIALIEINLFINDLVDEHRANKKAEKLFQEVEEIQNDFIQPGQEG